MQQAVVAAVAVRAVRAEPAVLVVVEVDGERPVVLAAPEHRDKETMAGRVHQHMMVPVPVVVEQEALVNRHHQY